MPNNQISRAICRVGVQRSLLLDLPNTLYGDDYESCFKSGIVDGGWLMNKTGSSKRRYRNGLLPNELWTICRNAIIISRRNKNLFCSPDIDTYYIPRENVSKIKMAGKVAFMSILHQIPDRNVFDHEWLKRHNRMRIHHGWEEIKHSP